MQVLLLTTLIADSFAAPLAEDGGHEFNPLLMEFGPAFWTWVIFLLSLPFMWKVVFGPITQALYKRDAKADDAITSANEARAAAEAARQETVQQLEAAKAEAQRQIREARERAEAQAKTLLEQARREADQDRQKAVVEIDAERRRALSEIRDLAVDLSLDAATRLVKRDLKGEDQKGFVKDFLSEVELTSN